MKPILALLTLVLPTAGGAAAPRHCELLWDYVLGFTPREMCEKANGYKCAASKSDSEAFCRASGRMDECAPVKNIGEVLCTVFHGNICNEAKTEVMGLCLAAGDSFCDKPNPDRRFWLLKLLEKCGKAPT